MDDAKSNDTQTENVTKKRVPKKINPLHDNPELPGKKFFLVSMISPESNQKSKYYGLKFHDVCEEWDEANDLAAYYKELDPVFDVLIGTIGKWCPWVFNIDDVKPKYADEQLNELVSTHREKAKKQDAAWVNHVNKHKVELSERGTVENQEKTADVLKESSVQMLFRLKQLELVIQRRNEEFNSLLEIYNERYSEEEKSFADTFIDKFPLSEPSVIQYKKFDEKEEEKIEDGKGKEVYKT
jgi:hypothetical protein